jgi:hypothetical protein
MFSGVLVEIEDNFASDCTVEHDGAQRQRGNTVRKATLSRAVETDARQMTAASNECDSEFQADVRVALD